MPRSKHCSLSVCQSNWIGELIKINSPGAVYLQCINITHEGLWEHTQVDHFLWYCVTQLQNIGGFLFHFDPTLCHSIRQGLQYRPCWHKGGYPSPEINWSLHIWWIYYVKRIKVKKIFCKRKDFANSHFSLFWERLNPRTLQCTSTLLIRINLDRLFNFLVNQLTYTSKNLKDSIILKIYVEQVEKQQSGSPPI